MQYFKDEHGIHFFKVDDGYTLHVLVNEGPDVTIDDNSNGYTVTQTISSGSYLINNVKPFGDVLTPITSDEFRLKLNRAMFMLGLTKL